MTTMQKQVAVVMLRDYYDVTNNIKIPATGKDGGPVKTILVEKEIATCMVRDGYADFYDAAADECNASQAVTRVGPQGNDGPPGRDGRPGTNGGMGKDGCPGRHGKDGRNGAKGAPGPRGHPGCDGPVGPEGKIGEPGCDGKPGKDGLNGTPGAKGQTGDPGQTGVKGDQGDRGATGLKGDPGSRGPVGLPGLSPVTRADIEDNCLVVITTVGDVEISRKKFCCDPNLSSCVSIVKSCPLGPYAAGDTVNYEICVRNCGQTPLTGVMVTSDAQVQGANIGNLGIGQKRVITGTSTVTQAQENAGSFSCAAGVIANGADGAVTDNTNHVVVTGAPPPAAQPCIAVTKTCDPGPYEAGDVVSFDICVTNCGNTDLQNISITSDSTLNTDAIDSLGAGQETCVVGTMTVTAAQANAGSFPCNVQVSGVGNGQTVNDSDTHTVQTEPPPGEPCIEITKTCDPGPYQAGDVVQLDICVTNCGDVPLTNVNISTDANLANNSIATIAVGAQVCRTGTVTVTQAQAEAGSFPCNASVAATGDGQTVTGNTSHTIRTEVPARETKRVCAKMNTAIIMETLSEPDSAQTSNASGDIVWQFANGISIRMNSIGTLQGAGAGNENCRVLRDVQGQRIDFSVSGLNALACNGCAPCVDVVPRIGSLDPGTTFTTDATYGVSSIEETTQQGNVFTGAGAGAGHIDFDFQDVNADGVFMSGTFGGVQDSTQICLQSIAVYMPVVVTCYADNDEFISAVDCDGNSVAENQIDFT